MKNNMTKTSTLRVDISFKNNISLHGAAKKTLSIEDNFLKMTPKKPSKHHQHPLKTPSKHPQNSLKNPSTPPQR